jgi:predicted N-acyltransferase
MRKPIRGEYVFDHGWAEAYERAGGNYYPKLQVSVPFTPATGRRLLVRPGPEADAVRGALADSLMDICRRSNASSAHVTFPTQPEWDLLGRRGFLKRTHQQFHWENAGYGSFDAFLAALASRKRKTIRREREDALSTGISVHWLTGADLTESVWDAFFDFYMETGSRKWGVPISRDRSIRWSARRCATASCW